MLSCLRGGSAPPWQEETFPRLSWRVAEGTARGLCEDSDNRYPFLYRARPQNPPRSQTCSTTTEIPNVNRCLTDFKFIVSFLNVYTRTSYLSGMRKCSSDQSSLREFCRGVPVMRSLWLDLNSINVLYSRESSFFSLWASSTPKNAQLMFPSTPWRQMLETGVWFSSCADKTQP